MSDPTTPGGGTPTPTRSAARRWLPWVGVLVAAALVFVLVRPSSDDEGAAAPSSSTGSGGGTGVNASGCDERQLASSDYGPCRIEPFTGDNGGATTAGVTDDTITVSLRLGSSTQMDSLNALAGDAASSLGSNQDEVVADVRALVDYFNDEIELYGRRVEVEAFEGQGDFVSEFQSQGVPGAQIDATRARDLGAFADISLLTQTQPYAEALTANNIVTLGPVYASAGWYADHAPYALGGPWPLSTELAEYAGNVVCERLAGDVAEFAGAPLSSEVRTFGLIYADVPEWTLAADALVTTIEDCGESVTRRLGFALDVLSMQGETTNAIAQMKAEGVTTIICICDEFSPLFLTSAAVTQDYEPEWLMQPWPDPWGRLAAQDQFARAMQLGGSTPVFADTEVGEVLTAATGSAEAASPTSIELTYQQVLLLFSALQAAGPDLTPETFQSGYSSLPLTDEGVFGPWEFGEGRFSPKTSFQLGWWSPDIESNLDGERGSIQDCGAGAWHPFDDAEGLAAEASPLGCFG